MKITKSQLKQIIKEELAQTLNELEDDGITKLATDAAGNASKKAVTKGIRGAGVRGIGGSLGALGAAASLVDLANPEGFYAQAGDATKGAYQDISKRAKEYFNPKKADKKKAANPAATRSTSTVSAPEQPMAEQLKQFIREELEVVLTNEEAGELFGEELEELLNEKDLEEKKKYKPSFYKAKEKRAEHLKSKGVDDDLAFAIADKQMSKAGKKKKK